MEKLEIVKSLSFISASLRAAKVIVISLSKLFVNGELLKSCHRRKCGKVIVPHCGVVRKGDLRGQFALVSG